MKKLLLTTAYLFIGSQTFADDSTKYQCGDAIFTIKSNPKSVSLDVSTNGNPVGSLRSFGGEKGFREASYFDVTSPSGKFYRRPPVNDYVESNY